MKVIVAVIFVVGSVSGLGSGPYLPSGWRPQGPAFYLPGEVQKPADNPLKEALLFETEASSSDALREYGPPKTAEVAQNVIQALPDVATEQAFLVIAESAGAVEAAAEVIAEQKSEAVQEATTETQIAEEKATDAILSIADIELQRDAATVSYEAEVKEELQATAAPVEIKEDIQATLATLTEVKEETETSVEKLEQIVEVEEKVVGEVRNVAETLVNLENEIKAEQVSLEAAAELKINEEESGSTQAPQGFLEYGPPGFKEYGPPKGDELLRSAVILESDASIENNEARRRRFSPKFRAPTNKRHH